MGVGKKGNMRFNEATALASDGTRLFCRIAGEGPTTLLFLHGWGGSGSGAFWDRALQHLDPSGLRLVLADLRGHGRSDHARDGFTTERFAEDMFEVADHAGAARLIIPRAAAVPIRPSPITISEPTPDAANPRLAARLEPRPAPKH